MYVLVEFWILLQDHKTDFWEFVLFLLNNATCWRLPWLSACKASGRKTRHLNHAECFWQSVILNTSFIRFYSKSAYIVHILLNVGSIMGHSILLAYLLSISKMAVTALMCFHGVFILLSSLQREECTRLVAVILRFWFLKSLMWTLLLTPYLCLHDTRSLVCGAEVSGSLPWHSPTPASCSSCGQLAMSQVRSHVSAKCAFCRLMSYVSSLCDCDLIWESNISTRQQETVCLCVRMWF